jgi:hypothetical protein
VEIGLGAEMARNMARVFARVADGGAIIFLCRNASVCDAAIGLLNVRMPQPYSSLRH